MLHIVCHEHYQLFSTPLNYPHCRSVECVVEMGDLEDLWEILVAYTPLNEDRHTKPFQARTHHLPQESTVIFMSYFKSVPGCFHIRIKLDPFEKINDR